MQYRKKILELVYDKDDDALINWLNEHDDLDKVEIMKEFAMMMKELKDKKLADFTDKEIEKALEDADIFLEKVLDVKVAELNAEFAEKDLEKSLEETYKNIDSFKAITKQMFALNYEDVDSIKNVCRELIKYEKRKNIYNPINWIGIEEHL